MTAWLRSTISPQRAAYIKRYLAEATTNSRDDVPHLISGSSSMLAEIVEYANEAYDEARRVSR
jgi:hypothetical protein